MNRHEGKVRPRFIDLFAGCGGFSLGLGNAGWEGVFAIEKDPMAFDTFRHNLLDGDFPYYAWPGWLPQNATSIQELLKRHAPELKSLKGTIDLVAGGPPCQGFSMAGQRNSTDPRNKLAKLYVEVVKLVQPKLIVLENVRGFNTVFARGASPKGKKTPYSAVVKRNLEALGYTVYNDNVHCERFGVPQARTRFIMIGILNEMADQSPESPFARLEATRPGFLCAKNLSQNPVTVKEALSDLETGKRGAKLVIHSGRGGRSFYQLDYSCPKRLNPYQQLMRIGMNGQKPNSLRLARHQPSTVEKFKLIQEHCSPGRNLSKDDKRRLGIKKQAIYVLDGKKPSNTLTTLPDDLLHYSEPRILTVRESARIQSFPDNFVFCGNYTTGGEMRTKQCPRYTQVGNAVPPLLAEALGLVLNELLS